MEIGRNNFDEQLRAALEGLENVPRTADWDDFANELEAAESADAAGMDDAAFDSLVAAGLGGLEVDFDPSSWDALEERMVSEEILEDGELDELARQSLNNYEVPYEKSHWEIMAERLEEEFSLRRKMYRYKVLELALMLLFIFTLINCLPFGANKFEELKAFDFELFKSNKEEKSSIFDNQKEEITTKPVQKEVVEATAPIADNVVLNQKKDIENTLNKANSPFQNTWKNTSSEKATIIKKTPKKLPTPQKEITSEPSDNIYVSNHADEYTKQSLATNLIEEENRNNQVLLDLLDLPKAELLDFNRVLPSMILVPSKEEITWRFSMVGNFEANYIFSPDNEELGSSQDTTLGLGYGGGILGGFKRGKWGFETGGIYNHKSYPPNFINQFNPNGNKNILESEYFQDIRLDLLQIPINVQYFVVNKSKWRVYASTGMSVNLLLSPLYQINETQAALTQMPTPTLGPPDNVPDKSLKNKTEFPKGILAGGNLKENSYLTAQFGLGIERSVGNRWSVFAQPNYQHYLSKNGLKPFRDKFYTLSLSVGTRVSIK